MITNNSDPIESQDDELQLVYLKVEKTHWTEARMSAARAASPPLPQNVYDLLGTLLREKLQDRALTPADQGEIARDLLSCFKSQGGD